MQQHTHGNHRQDRQTEAFQRVIQRLKAQFPELTAASIEAVLHGNYGQYPSTANEDDPDTYIPAPQRTPTPRRQVTSADLHRRA